MRVCARSGVRGRRYQVFAFVGILHHGKLFASVVAASVVGVSSHRTLGYGRIIRVFAVEHVKTAFSNRMHKFHDPVLIISTSNYRICRMPFNGTRPISGRSEENPMVFSVRYHPVERRRGTSGTSLRLGICLITKLCKTLVLIRPNRHLLQPPGFVGASRIPLTFAGEEEDTTIVGVPAGFLSGKFHVLV